MAKINKSEGVKSETSRGKRCPDDVWRNKHPRVLSQQIHTERAEFPQQQAVTICVKCCLLGKLIRDSGFVLGASHIGTLCSAHTKNPNSQKESRYTIQTTASALLFRGEVRTLPKFKFPYASQWLTLQAAFSKDNRLMLTLFHTACFEVWHTVDVQYTAAINTNNVMFLYLSLQEGELIVPSQVSSSQIRYSLGKQRTHEHTSAHISTHASVYLR